ncbi:MAG: YihY/virulence factor BrkB family protein [Deltaproteobacteria bacterium]|nr:YihY/virulence factor BrkB family protein [Deltaproteobacteria bacterium]
MKVLLTLLLTVHSFRRSHLEMHASGLSFYMMLSMVPFLAIILFLLDITGIPAKHLPEMLEFLAGGNRTLADHITQFALKARVGMMGTVGFGITMVIGFVLLQRVKVTLNTIWNVSKWASYRRRMAEYATVLAMFPLLLAITVGVASLLSSPPVRALLLQVRIVDEISFAMIKATSIMLLWMAVFYAYAILPDTKVISRNAAIGAVVGTLGLVVAQEIYQSFLILVTRQNVIYGALAMLPALMLWFYMGWMVFLFGAELTHAIQNYNGMLEDRRAELAESEEWWALEQEAWPV